MASVIAPWTRSSAMSGDVVGVPAHKSRHQSGLRDVGYFTLLLAIAASLLIVLRGSPTIGSFALPAVGASLLLSILWLRPWTSSWAWPLPRASAWRKAAPAIVGIACLTWAGFWLPQRVHFWGGWDDFQAHQQGVSCFWSDGFDEINGRPLLGWSYLVGNFIADGAIEGHLWFATVNCLINTLLLFGLLRLVAPEPQLLSVAASTLYVVNAVDPLSFYPLWAANVHRLAIGIVLLAFFLFALSWKTGSRLLLLAACFSLGVTLLMYEVGYALAILPVVYIWVDRKRNPLWKVWIYCWVATWTLFVLRVAIFQLLHASYQQNQALQANFGVDVLASNLLRHLKPTLRGFSLWSSAMTEQWRLGLAVSGIAATTLWLGFRNQSMRASARQWAAVMGLASLAIFLGVLPFTHITGLERTQFFAAPFQAVFAAAAIASVAHWLPERVARPAVCLVLATVCGNAAARSMNMQSEVHHVSYEKVVNVFEQLRAICPEIERDSLVLLVVEEQSPIGADYCTYCGSLEWIGARVAHAGDPNAIAPIKFEDGGIRVPKLLKGEHFDYERVIAFRIESDGTLHFLSTWPVDELGAEGQSSYAPLMQTQSAPIPPLRYLNLPAWKQRVDDVVELRNGVVMGAGWSARKFAEGWLYRDIEQNAELVVNSQGEPEFLLELDLAPNRAIPTPCMLAVYDSENRCVASAQLSGRQQVSLPIPCFGEHAQLLRIRVEGGAPSSNGRSPVLRAYCNHAPLQASPLVERPDITYGGVTIGGGWYSYETHGETCLRWLNTDGVILSGACAPGQSPAIILDAVPGPGMAGKPCEIELVNERGESLATASLTEAECITLTLPVDYPEGAPLTLKVYGGGAATPGDPRTLNLMVKRCGWESTATVATATAAGVGASNRETAARR